MTDEQNIETPPEPDEASTDVEKALEVGAVTSVTTATPSKADEDSSPGPYAGDGAPSVDDPPVRTTDPQTPIAHSLVAGAGAPHEDEAAAAAQVPAGDVELEAETSTKAKSSSSSSSSKGSGK